MCKAVLIFLSILTFLIKKHGSRQIQPNIKLVYMPINETLFNITAYNKTIHLQYSHIQERCKHRDSICKSTDINVCAMRRSAATEYKDFQNACYLFLSNMCDNPEKEYYIVSDDSCASYLNSRRSGAGKGSKTNSTTKRKTTSTTKMKSLYDIDTAFDLHICPMNCPDAYSPVCVNVNRGFGLYFKYFLFINHCQADVYYCKHWKDFQPPPSEDGEIIQNSALGWSYCGSAKYLQYARFSEVTSSMGHYGWLSGDFRFSHILSPDEKKPGYG